MDENLNFKIDEFLNLKETQKLSNDPELIKKCLRNLSFLKFSDSEKEAKIIFKENDSENSKIINLINVPHKITKECMAKILKLSEEKNVERFYKQSLYWIIVVSDKNTYNKIDETMRNIKFEDNNPLKFEVSYVNDMKKIAEKKISHQNYLKEANDLKASGAMGASYPDRKDSRGYKYSNNSGNGNEALSWRKKSDYSVNSGDK